MFNHKQQKGEGNAKRKSNRYSILMLALIFIGFATYGTYAYFTDSTSVGTDIELTAGTVSLGEAVSGNWQYDYKTFGNGYDRKLNLSSDKTSTNLQPGDAFTKTVSLKYTGSLDATISVKNIEETIASIKNERGYDAKFVVKYGKNYANSDDSVNTTFEVKPNDEFQIVMTVGLKLSDKAENFGSERNIENGLQFSEIASQIDITATQITATSTPK